MICGQQPTQFGPNPWKQTGESGVLNIMYSSWLPIVMVLVLGPTTRSVLRVVMVVSSTFSKRIETANTTR
jgi:hypothetical protein